MAEQCEKCGLPLANTGQIENGRKVLACDSGHPTLGDAVAEKCKTCGAEKVYESHPSCSGEYLCPNGPDCSGEPADSKGAEGQHILLTTGDEYVLNIALTYFTGLASTDPMDAYYAGIRDGLAEIVGKLASESPLSAGKGR